MVRHHPSSRRTVKHAYVKNLVTLLLIAVAVGNVQPQKALAQLDYARSGNILATQSFKQILSTQAPPTITPIDALPDAPRERYSLGESTQINLLKKLPSKFYFNAVNESSIRMETNPYQTPSRPQLERQILSSFPNETEIGPTQRNAVNAVLRKLTGGSAAFREQPNITAGWAVNPKTKVYANYFLIQDRLYPKSFLDSTVQSFGIGVQRDFPVSERCNAQLNVQARELVQTKQRPVCDYLPGVLLTYQARPNTTLFVNPVIQIRSQYPGALSMKEIDPFCTFGALSRHGRWQFLASATLLQNIRRPFGDNAVIPVNNSCCILDLEVDRQLFKRCQSIHAFVRAEPIYNICSSNTPGMSGFDLRIFSGLRMTLGKQPLTTTMNQVRERL